MRDAPVHLLLMTAVLFATSTRVRSQTAGTAPASEATPKTTPVDPTRTAAEILRRRLGLDPGAGGRPPSGPPLPEPSRNQDPKNTQQQAEAQQPAPRPPAGSPATDPTEQAARALRRLLPGEQTPSVAPPPDAASVPEPHQPGLPAAIGATHNIDTGPTTGWSGVLSARYRLRHGGGATDQDLVTRLGVDFGRNDDPWSLHVRGRAFVNVDGKRDDDPFPGLDHSFGDDVQARLYAAHLDLRQVPAMTLLRVGRQDVDETPVVLSFDGVRADSRGHFGRARAFVTAYAGVPVHQFEASSRDDLVAGAAAGCSPWPLARVRVDWMHLRDEFFAIDRQDTIWSLRWWQTVHESLRLSGLHSWRDGDARDLRLTALSTVGEHTDARVVYRELLSTQRQQVTDIDPFYTIAGEYRPYRQLELSLTRDLTERVTTSVGGDVRRLRDGGGEGTFNREFDHVFADITIADIATHGLSLTVAGNLWNSSGEDSRALTGELLYRPDRDLRAALGIAYDLFRYDVFAQRERVHVRSYYLRFDRRLDAGLSVDGGYELLRCDVDEFHLFHMGVRWTF